MKVQLLFYLTLLGLVFGLNRANAAPLNFNWTGGLSTDWNNSLNWTGGTIGHLLPIAGDAVFIGVNNTITLMPVIGASGGPAFACASLTFGNLGPKTGYLYGMISNISLTINGGFSLTVTTTITQNHFQGTTGNSYNYTKTTIKGSGTLICNGNFVVGDAATSPSDDCANVAQVSAQITQLTINGNIILNSTGNTKTVQGNGAGICYPYFSVEGGKTTLVGLITFNPVNAPFLNAVNIFNSPLTQRPGYGLFSADDVGNAASTLELQAQAPISIKDNFYVYFTYGGNNGTVIYNYTGIGNQTVYTANEPSVTTTKSYINTTLPAGSTPITTTSSANYYNLTLSGTNKKVIDANSSITGSPIQGLTVGNNFTTTGGVIDFNTNNPTATITGTWNNTTTATQGTGVITTGGMTNGAGGIVNCSTTANFVINGNYNNSNQFNTNATGQLFFSGTTQSLTDNTTAGTKFYKVTFNGGGTKTISSGPFAVTSNGLLTIGPSSTTLAANGNLTLMSDATGSANVAVIPALSSISGNVNVQRFLTGTNVKYRSYHLLSSPVNSSSAINGTGNIDLSYINTTKTIAGVPYPGALTAGPGGVGFTITNKNPVLYLYNESLPTNNTNFTTGKNVGIVAVGSSTVSTLSAGTTNTGVTIPVGNGIMFYFIGDNTSTNIAFNRVPENTTITAVGTINQQNVPVKLWNTGTTALYATNNLVGNPYPSSIDLNMVYSDNSATLNRIFYELYNINPNQNYISYNGFNGATSTVNGLNTAAGSRYIASGQGFFCTAVAGGTITFKEDQKVTNQLTGTKLLMSTPAQRVVQTDKTITLPDAINSVSSLAAKSDNVLTGLHLAMVQDSTLRDECGIYFSNNGIDKYDENDAKDLDGISPKVYMSSYTTDGVRTGINDLGSYVKGKRVKLFVKATTDGVYNLTLADIENIDVTNYNLYLKDNYVKDSLDLSHNSSYSFRINNSDTTTFGANRFELVIAPKPLPPYALTSFTAKKVNEGVLLTWQTANEGNYTGFTLEKQNSSQFTALNNLQSNGAGTYAYIDHNPTTGINAYRLMQSGLEANISYSETISILYNTNSLNLYPNPAKDDINIYVNAPTTDNNPAYQMSIYDSSGTLILTKQINKAYTQNVATLRIGTYIVQVTDNNGKLIGNTKFSKIQ
ncbi:MAG: T9SS type A sorting domain-containing protein [Bacteroidota bacterium]